MAINVQPYHLVNGEGQAFRFLGTLMTVKATGEQTGGGLGLVEQVLPAGSKTSYHVHRAEDEYWYVLEGNLTFISGENIIEATAGSFVFMPRYVPHGLRADTDSRLLVFSTPPGFVDFAIEMGEPVNALESQIVSPAITERRRALSAKYKIEVLGPLPDFPEQAPIDPVHTPDNSNWEQKAINQGDIFWIRPENSGDSELGEYPHPYVVVQEDVFNHSRIHSVVVCALTTNLKLAKAPGNVLLEEGEGDLPKRSVVVVSKVSAVDKGLLGEYVGSLGEERVRQILAGMRFLQVGYYGR